VTYPLVKETTEGAQTLKTNFETNISDTELVSSQKFFGFFNATLDQILVRSLVEGLPEEAKKVKARKTSLLGDLIQIKGMIITMIDKRTCPTETLESLNIWEAGFGFFGDHIGL
jgi:hypothetical protein